MNYNLYLPISFKSSFIRNCFFSSILIFIVLIFSGCGSKKAIVHNPKYEKTQPRKLAIFLDGTTNNESSHTNVSKLYNLVSLQNNPEIGAAYFQGVGNGFDFVGAMTGSGIRGSVCNAYLYLTEHYNHERNDEIYLFGFSRGAYAARILAGLIHAAGIVNISKIPKDKRLRLIKKVYNAHRGDKSLEKRREDVLKITGQSLDFDSYKIEFMGLWDTVAALGIPDYKDDYYVEETKLNDQLCNVKKAVQALSLNDNRGSVFTPSLLTHEYLVRDCKSINPKDVAEEVWFFGAHSDVGGGALNTNMSGVSLNWMIKQLKPYRLVPDYAEVYENRFDISNDPRKGFTKVIFPKKERKLVFFTSRKKYKDNMLKLHRSVLDRLEKSLQTYEINLIKLFGECFEKNDIGGYDYLKSSNCFIVEN